MDQQQTSTIESRQLHDRSLLESYLNIKYPCPVSIIMADPETLALDCFAQTYIFLAGSHSSIEWYRIFQKKLISLFAHRQQSRETVLALTENLAFTRAAQALIRQIPVE